MHVLVEHLNDEAPRLFRCSKGEFTYFPIDLPVGEVPPKLTAFSGYALTLMADRYTERVVGDRRFVDVEHGDTTWTYEVAQAFRAEAANCGGFFQWRESFDVGWWVD